MSESSIPDRITRLEKITHDLQALTNKLLPVGTILSFGGTQPPDGFLLCDAKDYDQNDDKYRALYDVIGDTFGRTSPTHFCVPETRGMFLRGWVSNADVPANFDLGIASRRRWINIDSAEAQAQSNTIGSFQEHGLSSHYHEMTYRDWHGAQSSGGPAALSSDNACTPFAARSTTSGGEETRPRNIAVNYIIKYR